MSRQIKEVFARARSEHRPAFIPYLSGGYPSKKDTVPLLLALEKAGADIIELGVPFSDPMADGSTIEKANFEALQGGVTLVDCLGFIKTAREEGLKVPVVLMGYANPFYKHGDEQTVKDAKEAGAQGFIVVDLPVEEASDFTKACRVYDLAFIPLIAPTSTKERMEMIARDVTGYVYLVSLTGVTGARTELPSNLGDFVSRARSIFGSDTPLVVGFGLSTKDHIAQVGKLADGAVVGSAIIKAVAAGHDTADRVKSVTDYVRSIL